MSYSLGRKFHYLTSDLDLWVKVTRKVVKKVTYADAKFEPATPNGLGGDTLHENTLFDLGVQVTQDIAQYSLHHVTYLGTKFEVATSNRLGGDTFTRNMTDGCTDGRWTDFGTKLIYPFFERKSGYNETLFIFWWKNTVFTNISVLYLSVSFT